MTEAVNALAHVAFRHFKAKRIEISTSDENFSAKRIPEKLNFDLEAEFINHHKNYATNKISNTLVYSCVDENRLPN
jgi:RimJ/RimL family protein N-acetyltransferase